MFRSLFCLSLMAASALGAELTRSANCEQSGFVEDAWPWLQKAEPAIYQELDAIAQASGVTGTDVPMTNCWVQWPVDENGVSRDGVRTVVMDKIWYKDERKYHAGMKVLYYKSEKTVNGVKEIYRNVKGYMICRVPSVCEAFGIPFGNRQAPPIPGSGPDQGAF